MLRFLFFSLLATSACASNINTDNLKYNSHIGSLKKDLSQGQSFQEEYKTGRFSQHIYKYVTENVNFSEKVYENDIFECDAGERNLSMYSGLTESGDQKRVLHDVFGYVGDTDTIVLNDTSKKAIYDSTSIYGGNQDLSGTNKGVEAITERMIEVYRSNSLNGRFCKAGDINRDQGEYLQVSKDFCSAGLESEPFADLYDGLINADVNGVPQFCKIVLDKTIGIGEARFISQAQDDYFTSAMVICKIENGIPKLSLISVDDEDYGFNTRVQYGNVCYFFNSNL
jgi:hypothetical protein